jgi:hypothetical protein
MLCTLSRLIAFLLLLSLHVSPLEAKTDPPTSCPSQTEYLRTAEDICGKTLAANGTKYVVSVPGNEVDCTDHGSHGPTVTGNAILDCSDVTIKGNLTNLNGGVGITVGGSAVIQNCAVSNFMLYGVVLDKTPGDKTVINTRAQDNGYYGFFIEVEANNNNNKLVNIES